MFSKRVSRVFRRFNPGSVHESGEIAAAGLVVDIRLKDRSEKPTREKITFALRVIRGLVVGKTGVAGFKEDENGGKR